MTGAGIIGAFAFAMVALGQTVQVLPPSYEGMKGEGGSAIPLGNVNSGTYQVMYGEELLANIPIGSVISGMQIRLAKPLSSPYPWSGAGGLSQYDVTLASSARTPATMSSLFANNMVRPVLVRSGPMLIDPGSYTLGNGNVSQPAPWGPLIAFTTPYVYGGGPLVIEMRVDGPPPFDPAYADEAMPAFVPLRAIEAVLPNATQSQSSTAGGLIVRLALAPGARDTTRGVTQVVLDEGIVGYTGAVDSSSMMQTTERKLMQVASEDQFDTLGRGSDFVGMTWRRPPATSLSWPVAPVDFADFTVQLSRSTRLPGLLSTTFAQNIGADATTVRTGALEIPVGGFGPTPTGYATGQFGTEIAFSRPYEYRGGPLLTLVNHSGSDDGTVTYFDAIHPAEFPYGTRAQAILALSSNASTGSEASFTVTKFSVDAGTTSPLNSPAPTGGTVGGLPVRFQTILSASELRYVPVGSVIESLWLRMRSGVDAAPTEGIVSQSFELTLSSATAQPADMSQSFDANEGPDKVVVFNGVLGIPIGAIPAGTTGRFGKVVQFKKQFVYQGGPLCVTIRHSGLEGGELELIEALTGTGQTNRSLYSTNAGASGLFFAGNFTGTAIKLGYIPSLTTPNARATQPGVVGLPFGRNSAFTLQSIVAKEELQIIPHGAIITGMSLRHSSSTSALNFPDGEKTLSRFDVTLSHAPNPPLLASNNFAQNLGTDQVLARSGPLVLPYGAFEWSGDSQTASQNDRFIQFTRPFIYTGGDLTVLIRGEGKISPDADFDSESASPNARGKTVWHQTSADATSGSAWGPLVIRFAYTPVVFCPWDLNRDGLVGDDDFSQFLPSYNTMDCADGAMVYGCRADFNLDRAVDDLDFLLFLAAYEDFYCQRPD